MAEERRKHRWFFTVPNIASMSVLFTDDPTTSDLFFTNKHSIQEIKACFIDYRGLDSSEISLLPWKHTRKKRIFRCKDKKLITKKSQYDKKVTKKMHSRERL
ncbi:hypothetical protein P5673_024341 [Acropora cervicornis]|uniref:Uncharacterized protein n=1 Tax=Acropora cervicornis TaxID=6130 RepID=A0AAD9Q4R1_ACRCE|nr:hypothetical protein P5673_024341 [Acropora cervicornis]